jgi:hypothetical protein
MQNSQDVAMNIKKITKFKKITIGKMLSDCDLSKNTLSTMQSRGYLPRAETLIKIADYLDCSVDYLLGRTDIQEIETFIRAPDNTTDYIVTTNKPEATLLIEFRNLNKQGQEYIMQTMDMVKDKYKKSSSISSMEVG